MTRLRGVRSQSDHTTLPRFLLRGFTFQEKAGKRRHNCVYLYTKENPDGFSEHISQVSAEIDFFGRPGEREVETKLSGDEGRYARLVADLRKHLGILPADSGPLAAEFVGHFIRSANMRYLVTSLGEGANTIIGEELTPEKAKGFVDELVEQHIRDLPPAFRKWFDSLSESQRKEIIAAARHKGLDKAEQLSTGSRYYQPAEAVRHYHFDQLEADFASSGVTQALAGWTWSIEVHPPDSLVIGDVGPILGNATGELHGLFPTTGRGERNAVYLPIAHDRLLIGRRPTASQIVDLDQLNLAMAELSREFVVSHAATARERRYAAQIGSRFIALDLEKMRADFRVRFHRPTKPS